MNKERASVERRGTCSVCEAEHAVTASGKVRQHKRPTSWVVPDGLRVSWIPCDGTGQPPTSYAEDPIAVAEARGYQKAIDALRAEGVRALERFTEAGSDSPKWDAYDAAADWLEFLREEETPPMRGDGK